MAASWTVIKFKLQHNHPEENGLTPCWQWQVTQLQEKRSHADLARVLNLGERQIINNEHNCLVLLMLGTHSRTVVHNKIYYIPLGDIYPISISLWEDIGWKKISNNRHQSQQSRKWQCWQSKCLMTEMNTQVAEPTIVPIPVLSLSSSELGWLQRRGFLFFSFSVGSIMGSI